MSRVLGKELSIFLIVLIVSVGVFVAIDQSDITGQASFAKQIRKQMQKIQAQVQALPPVPQPAPVSSPADTGLVETRQKPASFGTLPSPSQQLPTKALPLGVGV